MSNDFNVNSTFLFILVGAIILFVIAQSVYFLVKAVKRAKELNISAAKVKKTASGAAVFTIAPAIAILIGVVSLSKKLGVPLPWLRLSVIGSITYELSAAETAAKAVGTSFGESGIVLTAAQYTSIAFVMALGIVMGLIFVPILSKKILGGMASMKAKDEKWGNAFQTALFLGMISAFLGVIFADVTTGFAGFIPVFVMIASAIIMLILGLLIKKLKWRWLTDYALPVSMLAGMALSIPITNAVALIAG